MDTSAAQLRPYLDQLKRLPFVKNARLVARPAGAALGECDAFIALTTTAGETRLPTELKRSHLSREAAEHLVSIGRRVPGLLVLAPLVGPHLGELFAEGKINFIDLVGNCHLRIGDQFLAHVQGQRGPARQPMDRSLRAPAFSVLFALLANPELAHATTRTLAEAAGNVSPQTAADLRAKLTANGALIKTKGGVRWAPGGRKQALDMFLFAFPHLISGFMIGRFRAKHEDPTQLEADLTPRLNSLGEWRWGGGAAAQRLTHYYRGERTIVYLRDRNPSGMKRLPLVPDPHSKVVLMGGLGPLALQGPIPEVVHPLLAYADLLHEGHDRAREAADQVFQSYLTVEESAT